MTLQEWIDSAATLRDGMFAAEADFFLHLLNGERSQEGLWRAAFGSFERLLKDRDLCDAARYSGFRDAAKVLNPDVARRTGVDGFVAAARIQNVQKREQMVASCEAFYEEHKFPPSRQTTERYRQQIAPVEREPRVLTRQLSAHKLAEENAALRRELAVAKKRIAELEGQVAKVTKKKSAA